MKNHSWFLLILVIFSNADILAQSTVIDSVVVKSCLYQPVDEQEYFTTTIDSFSVDGLLISSTQLDSLNSIMSIDNYNYSSSGKMLLHTRQDFLAGVSVDSASHSYIYNASDSLLNYTLRRYNYGTFLGSIRIICQYDSINRTKLETSESGSSSGVWVLFSQVLYSFDSSNKLIRQENSYFTGGILTRMNSKSFEYLSNDSLDLYYFHDYSPTSQSDSGRFNYTYDSLGYLISIERSIWDSSTSGFTNTLEYWNSFYDSLHFLVGISSGYYLGIPGAQWERNDSTYYEYDSQGRLIHEQEGIMPHGGHWTNYIYYAGTNDIDSINYCRWATQSGNCSFCKYEYFSLILDVKEREAEHFTIFPNPASSNFNLDLGHVVSGNVKVVITDLQSKIVYTKTSYPVSGSLVINNTDLAAGVYFVMVSGNDYTGNQRLIIAK